MADNVHREEVVAVACYRSREASKLRANAMKREQNITMTSVFFPIVICRRRNHFVFRIHPPNSLFGWRALNVVSNICFKPHSFLVVALAYTLALGTKDSISNFDKFVGSIGRLVLTREAVQEGITSSTASHTIE